MGWVQAHAWVALGKFCLVNEATAKKCVPLFVQELGRATNPAVRPIDSNATSSSHPTLTSNHTWMLRKLRRVRNDNMAAMQPSDM